MDPEKKSKKKDSYGADAIQVLGDGTDVAGAGPLVVVEDDD